MDVRDDTIEDEPESSSAIKDLELEAQDKEHVTGGKVTPRDISITKMIDKSTP